MIRSTSSFVITLAIWGGDPTSAGHSNRDSRCSMSEMTTCYDGNLSAFRSGNTSHFQLLTVHD